MSKPMINFLTQEEMEAIHNASLQVLEKTGVKVMSEIALDILKKRGGEGRLRDESCYSSQATG